MRLYHRWKCPWCAAVRQAIENAGLEVELVEVPYPREERHEVVRISGQARVPVLVDGAKVIVDSEQIVSHLAVATQWTTTTTPSRGARGSKVAPGDPEAREASRGGQCW